MKREFLITGDGSLTIHLPEWNEQYHSKHGALAEAQHVFIESGLHHFIGKENPKTVSILEIGFGTGLNAFLTLLFCSDRNIDITYTGVEAYPVMADEIEKLNYAQLTEVSATLFKDLHNTPWEVPAEITNSFQLTKQKKFFSEINNEEEFDIIYFDAFGPRVQPDLWTEEIFSKMYSALKPGGVLVTYSAKGSVRRAMQAMGFTVERLPGPPGKREMLRGSKIP
ncbi:SAM-dependent methyltransferase [Pukyongia salina]|uniref:SAM-dependent methyltransferase n=1 Tax=Pukyongia salina TaxID=2094025 RepID=A0A2S0HXN0_9FLAO|nr:tRNA (5-methylaminomethyl-2-thiouridine)(34)-methyltransferase MnmD [Pukyongia salina]AVI51375.1 SAM-dependent methyltransferase [Pukyongia salina]